MGRNRTLFPFQRLVMKAKQLFRLLYQAEKTTFIIIMRGVSNADVKMYGEDGLDVRNKCWDNIVQRKENSK